MVDWIKRRSAGLSIKDGFVSENSYIKHTNSGSILRQDLLAANLVSAQLCGQNISGISRFNAANCQEGGVACMEILKLPSVDESQNNKLKDAETLRRAEGICSCT